MPFGLDIVQMVGWALFAAALLIFGAFPLGVYMHDLPLSPTKLQYYSYHKWIGITVLLLVITRVVWRFTHTPPPLPAATPRWEVAVSHITHLALDGLLIVIPLSGMSIPVGFGAENMPVGMQLIANYLQESKLLNAAHRLQQATDWHLAKPEGF